MYLDWHNVYLMLTFSMIYFSMLTLWCIWLKAFTQSWPRVAPQLRMKYFVYLFCETFTVWKLSTSNYNISILFSALTTNNPVWMWVKIGPRYPTLIHDDEMGKVIRMWSQKKINIHDENPSLLKRRESRTCE